MGFLAAVGGFFLVPMGVGLGARLVTHVVNPGVSEFTPRSLALVGLLHASGSYACYKLAAKPGRTPGWKSFLRGGMWGEGIGAAGEAFEIGLLNAGLIQDPTKQTTASVSTPSGLQQLATMHNTLMQAGWFKR
jgi:hypothetical protein